MMSRGERKRLFKLRPPWTDTTLNCCMSRDSNICVSFIGRCLNRLRRGPGHELTNKRTGNSAGSCNFNEMDFQCDGKLSGRYLTKNAFAISSRDALLHIEMLGMKETRKRER